MVNLKKTPSTSWLRPGKIFPNEWILATRVFPFRCPEFYSEIEMKNILHSNKDCIIISWLFGVPMEHHSQKGRSMEFKRTNIFRIAAVNGGGFAIPSRSAPVSR